MRKGWSKCCRSRLTAWMVSGVYPLQRQVAEPTPLLSHEEPGENFSYDQGAKHPCVGRRIRQPHQSHEGFQQIPIQATLSKVSKEADEEGKPLTAKMPQYDQDD